MIPPKTIDPGMSQGNPLLLAILVLVVSIFSIISYWKLFVKAGKPGWAVLIPFYNLYVMIEIAKKPGWWLLLYFIPIVNIVVSLIVAINLAKVFGKSTIFGVVFNWLIHPIGALILGFGSAKYNSSAPINTPPTPPQEAPAQPIPAPVSPDASQSGPAQTG